MPKETETVENVCSCQRYTFQDLGILSCFGGHDLTRAHQLYVISDGISALHVGAALKEYRTAANYTCQDTWCNTTCAHDCAKLDGGISSNFSRCMFECFISHDKSRGLIIEPGCPDTAASMSGSGIESGLGSGIGSGSCCIGKPESWCAENYANGTSCVNNTCGSDACCVPDGWVHPDVLYEQFVDNQMPAWVRMLGTPDCRGNASLVHFDLSTLEVSVQQVKGLVVAEDEWCAGSFNTSNAARVMWTVNGRVMYRKCGAKAQLNMVLGGSMHDAMGESDLYQFQTCAADRFHECNEIGKLVGSRDSIQEDVFAHVDESGFLYFMDSGGTDGLFGCKSKDHYGLLRTSIEVGAPFANDYHLPQETALVWTDGDNYPKNLTLYIVRDGFVDSAVWEYLTIYLYHPTGAALDFRRKSIEVRIRDIDGPGEVTMSVNHSHQLDPAFRSLRPAPVPERGICCGGNCAEVATKPEEAIWCARATLHRSSARGDHFLMLLVSSRQ